MGLRDILIGVAMATLAFMLHNQYQEYTRKSLLNRVVHHDDKVNVNKLKEHTKIFRSKEIIQVTPRIHVATGFALANSILIEGVDGIVIVDVTESVHAGKEVLAAFRNITNKPVKGIIYTHNHADHTYGAMAFIEDLQHPPEIWAHQELVTHLQRHFYTNNVLLSRAIRMFGVLVPELINAGIGPRLHITSSGMDMGIVYPNKLMVGMERDITIAGVNLKLVHIPGETEDQIGVWVPSEKAFLCADDVYEAFPNLYSIRGTPTRDLLHWASSLDRVIAFRPDHLVPSHTRPKSGFENIKTLLTDYRDAIQFVHDQALRYMNKGYLPDEIAAAVKLPAHQAKHPYLQEFYGNVAWSAKGVFNGYMGWFSGDPVDLTPLTPNAKAQKMVDLAGGLDEITHKAKQAFENKDYQWALMLSSSALRVSQSDQLTKEIKAKSLMALGEQQVSPNGRNYYYTCAMEELGEANVKPGAERIGGYIRQIPMMALFKTFQIRWNIEECGVVTSTVLFHFGDTKETITMTLRNGVVLISDRAEPSPDITVKTSSKIWREAIISSFNALTSFASGDLAIEGSANDFKNIMKCFDNK